MRALSVRGGAQLFGEVNIGGSKNAALPIIFATLITKGTSVIKNLPNIGDVRTALKIVESLGAKVERHGKCVKITTSNTEYQKPPHELVCAIRASTYLIGACLSGFGICHIQPFGGCNFSKRPIDFHLKVAESMGAVIDDDIIRCEELRPAIINLPQRSVGATVNALIMASATDGISRIYGMAREPHILSLVDFLRSAGAEINLDDGKITVKGGALHGGNITLIGDMIEAGTYLTAGLVTDGDITVRGIDPSELSPFISALSMSGISFDIGDQSVRSYGRMKSPLDVTCAPYPAFPTDLQPIIATLCAVGAGGKLCDKVFPERFGYLSVLSNFGIRHNTILDTAYIYSSDALSCANVTAPDLRGGAACIIAALAAKGQSRIDGLTIIERGYEGLCRKLRALGADVAIVG